MPKIQTDEELPQKYVVIPIQDFEKFVPEQEDRDDFLESTNSLEPETYFVIMSQDVFGPSALYGYAHVIQSALEVHQAKGDIFSQEEEARLQYWAHKITLLADEWQLQRKKIPD